MKNSRAKTLLAALTASTLIFGSSVVASSPASAATADGFDYETIGDEATITGCEDATCPTELEVPAAVDGYTVKKIDVSAFRNMGLTKVTFDPSSQLDIIGDWSFSENPDLTGSVAIPESVTEIWGAAFYGNTKLTAVTFTGSNLTTIGVNAFRETGLTYIDIPNGVTNIQGGAFDSSKLTNLHFEDGSQLTSIGDAAFASNSLPYVSLPPSVTEIGGSAFWMNDLESVHIPANVTEIGSNAFASNEISNLTFAPEGALSSIGERAFEANQIPSVDIPSSVDTIMYRAFDGNGALDDVKFLGDKPETLETEVFRETGTEPIYYRSSTSGWDGTTVLDGRTVTGVSAPVIESEPAGGTLSEDGHLDLSVVADSSILGQGELSFIWFKDGNQLEGESSSTYSATTPGTYQVLVISWVGATQSADAVVSAPTPTPTPTPTPSPKPKPVMKKKQSAKVKLPSKLKRNKSYKLPAKTKAGVKLSWKASGAGKCKINKKKHTIKCARSTGKKHVRLTGTAKATSAYHAYKVTVKRRVR